jgi:ATP-dependent DNA helicase RecQ
MKFFALSAECLRGYILKCFGETPDAFCGNCGNCTDNNFERVDITEEAKKIVSLVFRLESERNRNYGIGTLASVLLGKTDARTEKFGLHGHRLFGLMSEYNRKRLSAIFNFLLAEKFLAELVRGQFTVVTLGERAEEVKPQTFSITAKLPVIKGKTEKIKVLEPQKLFAIDNELFEKLRALRSEVSREESVPAYAVFSDAALKDMCAKMPRTKEEFLSVSGIGSMKAEKYFERFSAAISEHSSGRSQAREARNGEPAIAECDIFAVFRSKNNALAVSRIPVSVEEFCGHIARQLDFGGELSPLIKAVEQILVCEKYAKYTEGGNLIAGEKHDGNVLRRLADFDDNGAEIYVPYLSALGQGLVLEKMKGHGGN